MTITMENSRLVNFIQIKEFLHGTKQLDFSCASKKEKYAFIKQTFDQFKFTTLSKKQRGLIRRYIRKVTGYSVSQITRVLAKSFYTDPFVSSYKRTTFPRKYSVSDILLLCKTDNAHSRLNACATKKILAREFEKFERQEYENISKISVSHIYNLRKAKSYKTNALTFTKTQATQRAIGERAKPEPDGKPGYIRIDSVHQGDNEYEKGVYHINSVDEVIQWEIVASVEKLSESFLKPILLLLLNQYPFRIKEFHADNGSEYINHMVAKMLNKLLIRLTKSRARHSNDNALAEGKNGSIVRKHMGYFYINQKYAPIINDFYRLHFNPYLNYHRPCGYPTEIVDAKGKVKKIYKSDDYMTPYEKLKSIKNASSFLKENITFKDLDKIAYKNSDNEFAEIMEIEKQKLFDKIVMKPIDI